MHRISYIERIIKDIPDYEGVGIYIIENMRTNKPYIGSSNNIRRRIIQHDVSMRNGQCNKKFYEDVENGDIFRASIIEKLYEPTLGELLKIENKYMREKDSVTNGYNIGFNGLYDHMIYKGTKYEAYFNQIVSPNHKIIPICRMDEKIIHDLLNNNR